MNEYYHTIIELNTKEFKKLYELDKTKKETIEEILKPYKENKIFFFDDREISKQDIKSIKIYKTEQKAKILADIENNKNDILYVFQDYEVIEMNSYSKNVTKELIKEVGSLIQNTKKIKNLDLSKVFIVHGHNEALKLEVGRFLEKLDIKPIILHEQANEGRTIIEKIEANTDVGFGIVLYTPCDVGGKDKNNLQKRARQNVVFEHGYLIGKLGRKRVVAVVKDDNIEKPSDISGVVYISYNNNWQFDIAKELKSAGYSIDLNKLL